MARIRVGISGWSYPYWRGDFYPPGLPQRRELEYAAQRLDTVEINGSFYSLQRPSSYRSWAEATGEDFVFAIKGSRYVTHLKRLRDVDTGLANFFASGVLALGARTGPFLWQLPERHAFDADELTAFCARLPRSTVEAARLAGQHDDKVKGDRVLTETDVDLPLRHALEPRHPSFAEPRVRELLGELGVALVLADTGGRFVQVDAVTADFAYLRLHGPDNLYDSGYDDDRLDAWAARCRDWQRQGLDVYVYFDNDGHGHAPRDALRLRERVGGDGR